MASVLITGASKGIGRATAAEFARRGHRVIATARDPRTLAGLPADQRLALDVTSPDSITSAVGEAGEIDVLVSNAGEIFYAAVEATPPEAVRAAAGHQHDRCPAGGAGGPARDARPRPRAAAVHVQHRRAHRAGRPARPTPRPNGPSRRWSRPWPSRRARWGSRPRCSNRARSAPARSTTSPPTPCPAIPTPTCSPGRPARQPDDHAGRSRGRDRRRGRSTTAAPAHPHRPARRRDPGRTPGRTRRPPVHPRCIHGRPVVNGK